MEALKPAFNALDAIISNIEAALNASPTKPDHNSSGQPHNAKQSKPSKKEKKQKKAPVPNVPVETAQFLQCDLRVAQVTSVTHHPEADGLFVLQLTYANDVNKTVCAGLRHYLSDDDMLNRMVVTICNLKPRKLRGIASEAMVLAGSIRSSEGDKQTVVPIAPPEGAAPGSVVSVRGMDGERTVEDGKFVSGKTWDKIVPRLGVTNGNACYDGNELVVDGASVTCDLPDGAEIH
ncbi:Tyrosine--tRNA ligase, cytoplasmic [Gracilariopsis chorda]|uniref:Tyrosine--tRNA ligase, cytoplasmic n=1 Tax=Gracilariopsis chorda TaxID=448386 RepID=A0A2V3IJ52_9FLOR|nr:Tyrosine--tRNA ligase, cytoplasmic [Gracilariopsis chorda]|eukprot:PXF42063.1 Tyrosine--tRNA ligase, cytoplasmic [Gracilariopsis chorda]